MYTANRKCTSAFKLVQQNTSLFGNKSANHQELNAFKFNRDQVRQSALYSTQTSHKPIKKLMVANRG